MSITVKQEMDFEDLMNNCWRGAINTLQRVEEEGKEEELIMLLEEVTDNQSMTTINDIHWFDDEFIFKNLGIIEEEEEEEEEE